MAEETLLKPIIVIIGLLYIAVVSAIVVKRARFPYTIGLVLVGIALAELRDQQAVESLLAWQGPLKKAEPMKPLPVVRETVRCIIST